MKRLYNNTSLLVRSLLLVLFISYSVSVMLFYHTHMVEGFLITHSHPYKLPGKKGAVENHKHSTSQYILLQHICETSITDSIFEFAVVPDLLSAICSLIISLQPDPYFINVTLTDSLRGPPVC